MIKFFNLFYYSCIRIRGPKPKQFRNYAFKGCAEKHDGRISLAHLVNQAVYRLLRNHLAFFKNQLARIKFALRAAGVACTAFSIGREFIFEALRLFLGSLFVEHLLRLFLGGLFARGSCLFVHRSRLLGSRCGLFIFGSFLLGSRRGLLVLSGGLFASRCGLFVSRSSLLNDDICLFSGRGRLFTHDCGVLCGELIGEGDRRGDRFKCHGGCEGEYKDLLFHHDFLFLSW